jgi:hypothetical protein
MALKIFVQQIFFSLLLEFSQPQLPRRPDLLCAHPLLHLLLQLAVAG